MARRRLNQAELEALAIRVERRILIDLAEALQRARAGIKLTEIERALIMRNLDAAIEAIGLEPVLSALHQVEVRTAELKAAAFEGAVLDLPRGLQQRPLLELNLAAYFGQRPDVRKAIDDAGAKRIVELTKETKEALRGVFKRGLDRGVPPRELAARIRPMIGLTGRQAAAVDGYRERLEASGGSPSLIDRAVERYATKQLNLRATNIARTESLAALNLGKRIQWERLEAAGEIEKAEWEQEWVTAADERTCPVCEPLHGDRAPIGGTFDTANGPVAGPPAHPRCRCITRLTLAGFGADRPVNRFRPFAGR